MISHVGGITAARQTTLELPRIPGGKKLIYTQRDFPLTAIDDFAKAGQTSAFFADLATICARHQNLWNVEAENYVLAHAPRSAQ
jgi:hypothetical protein